MSNRGEVEDVIVKYEMWLTRANQCLDKLDDLPATPGKAEFREKLIAYRQALIGERDRWWTTIVGRQWHGEDGERHAVRRDQG